MTTSDAFLAKDGENLLVRADDKEILRTPIHYLEGIVTFGYTGASPALMGLCAEKGVARIYILDNLACRTSCGCVD